MLRSDETHERGALRGALAFVLLLALLAGGVAVWRYDLIDRFTDDDPGAASPGADPATVAPPPGIEAPAITEPDPVALTSPATRGVDPAAVRRALAPYLTDGDLGRHVVAVVEPLGGTRPVFTRGDDAAVPASTTKLVTATAALLAMGPDHVFTTEVRRAGGDRIALVGGGDPLLERGPLTAEGEVWPYPVRADLTLLAEQTAASLRADGVRRVRLGFDDSLFSGPTDNPTWERDYVPEGEVSPTTALWVDEGRVRTGSGRVDDPSAEAAASFVEALRAEGIVVRGQVGRGRAGEGEVLASVDSAPLGQVVERVLDVSDNDASEVLLRHVGLAVSGEGSIEAGVAGVRATLRGAGLRLGDSVFHDGSGLSRANLAEPALLVDLLQLAASPDQPGLRPVVAGLPVAGFSGSLTDRMDTGDPAGRGRVRAKTGTLRAVFSLAGLATDLDGNVLVFALMTDRVRPLDTVSAQAVLDNAAAALGACSCSRG